MADDLTLEARLLGIDDDELRVLALLPLVRVAWADGAVQDEERAVILDLATGRYGLDDDARRVLETWLTYPPSETYYDRGQRLMARLVRTGRLGFEVDHDHPFDAMAEDALAVAKAAGGWFGFRAVDATEQAALETIREALAGARAHAEAEVHDEPSFPPRDPGATLADPGFTWDGSEDEESTDVFSQEELHAIASHREAAARASGATFVGPGLLARIGDVVVPYALRDGQLTIGRHRDNDIMLPQDHLVSRVHARVYDDGDRTYVADLGSTNGTFVNGERVVERRLFGEEEIRVGQALFTYKPGPDA